MTTDATSYHRLKSAARLGRLATCAWAPCGRQYARRRKSQNYCCRECQQRAAHAARPRRVNIATQLKAAPAQQLLLVPPGHCRECGVRLSVVDLAAGLCICCANPPRAHHTYPALAQASR